MSLSGALSNALSGLTANSRAASLVASNIANATTESYGRRILSLSSRASGTSGGVMINGVVRSVNTVILADRRLSDAQSGFANNMQAFASRVENIVGASGEAGSLTQRFSAFENALLSAASDPSSVQRLQAVSQTANDFATTLNTLSNGIQSARTDADRSISSQVDALNAALTQVDSLNTAIAEATLRGSDASSLMDERQRVIDGVSDIVPLRIMERENGVLAIHTASGAVLLDNTIHSEPAVISFSRSAIITADMSLGNGLLSGIEINGTPVNSTNGGPLGGGTLGAQLQIRDTVAVEMQSTLDGLARDLIDRFSAGGPDATIAVGDPGLFTDEGATFDPLNETGIAARIRINDLVAASGNGQWRLRDGLGAAAQGDVGNAGLLQAYSGALEELTVPGSTSLATGASSFGQHVADFHAAVSYARVRSDSEVSFSSAQHTALKELELSDGVDTDAELQNLMLIEQHYAANARVMTVVDELMQTLMRI